MSKKQNRERKNDTTQTKAAMRRIHARLAILLTTLAVVIITSFFLFHGKLTITSSSAGQATRESVAGTEVQAKFQRLKGRWRRPDGGYVIEIKDIDANGQMAAAYFNPRPINVSQAKATLNGTTLEVFVELRDVNYPGATYNLAYDPQSDRLHGVYFQPALQQSFDVFFVRIK